MSESFTWRPLDNFRDLPVRAPGAFRKTLEEVFGRVPYTFGDDDRKELRALSIADSNNAAAWKEILSLLDSVGCVCVEAS